MRLPLIRLAPDWAFTAHLLSFGVFPSVRCLKWVSPVFSDVTGSRSRSISLAAEITVAQEVSGYELRCDMPVTDCRNQIWSVYGSHLLPWFYIIRIIVRSYYG